MCFHFRIGAKVVCVNIRPNKEGGGLHPTYADTRFPVVGGIYTIRRIFDARQFGHDDLAILLVEVRNRVRPYTCARGHQVRCEQFWLAFRFRPLSTTSIDVFLEMLEPEPARKVRETVDA